MKKIYSNIFYLICRYHLASIKKEICSESEKMHEKHFPINFPQVYCLHLKQTD